MNLRKTMTALALGASLLTAGCGDSTEKFWADMHQMVEEDPARALLTISELETIKGAMVGVNESPGTSACIRMETSGEGPNKLAGVRYEALFSSSGFGEDERHRAEVACNNGMIWTAEQIMKTFQTELEEDDLLLLDNEDGTKKLAGIFAPKAMHEKTKGFMNFMHISCMQDMQTMMRELREIADGERRGGPNSHFLMTTTIVFEKMEGQTERSLQAIQEFDQAKHRKLASEISDHYRGRGKATYSYCSEESSETAAPKQKEHTERKGT